MDPEAVGQSSKSQQENAFQLLLKVIDGETMEKLDPCSNVEESQT